VARVARSSPYVKAISLAWQKRSPASAVSPRKSRRLSAGSCYRDLGSGIHAACGDPGETAVGCKSDPGADFCTGV
jgi:hypothetical protein